MIRRIKRYKQINDVRDIINYPISQTSQIEPNLHELLVKYSHGEDISAYISPASHASAEMQFQNRLGKVDYLTEMHSYVKDEAFKAKKALEQDKLLSEQKKSVESPKNESTDEKKV